LRFRVLTAASMKFKFVFRDVLPCKIIVDRRFRGTCCLHHQGDDGGSTYLWNVRRRLFYTAVHPRRQIWTSYSPPWELETSHVWTWQRPRVDGPALSPEKTPHDDSKCNSQTYDLKSGHESQKGARHQDRLADCKVTWLGLRLQRVYRDWNHLLTEEQSTPFAYVCQTRKPTFNTTEKTEHSQPTDMYRTRLFKARTPTKMPVLSTWCFCGTALTELYK
jgi:hypothetical protein